VAGHSHLRLPAEEPADFGPRTARAAGIAKIAAAAGLLVAVVIGVIGGEYFRTFYFAYLTGFAFFLAIALGALFFVLIHHVSRAGWSVNLRRVAENMAATLPVLGLLSLPILVSVLLQQGDLYRWALPDSAGSDAHHVAADQTAGSKGERAGETAYGKGAPHGAAAADHATSASGHEAGADHESDPGRGKRTIDEITIKKRAWLNPLFFTLRVVIYFALWSVTALYYLRKSSQQDVDGDYRHTAQMQKWSGLALVFFGITVTLAAWDLFMSLDPHWYSTMFGVYYFASGAVLFFAAMIVTISLLQKAGFLREAVTVEHFHDLGKYLFAFTFFWGYVTFSQYMLIWYASIPEEVGWPARHGMSTAKAETFGPNFPGNQWQPWSIAVLLGCLLIPFAGLLSRHVKRNRKAILFWAWWLIVFQFVNMVWIVIPEMRVGFKPLPIVGAVAAWVGIGGVLVAAWLRVAARHKLRPVNDPRVFESAVFVNI
jgi:hypothetical protein